MMIFPEDTITIFPDDIHLIIFYGYSGRNIEGICNEYIRRIQNRELFFEQRSYCADTFGVM